MGRGICRPRQCCECPSSIPGRADRDRCMCGCGYLNGGLQIVFAQFLLFFGNFFSMASLGDCSFVSLHEGLLPHEESNLDGVITRVGFITFQKPNGLCYWYENGTDPEGQLQYYFEELGSDWQFGRICAGIASCGGWLYFFYSWSYCCSSQVRAVRYFSCFMLSFVLTFFQSMTFLIIGSKFCDEQGCKLDRSAAFSIAASCCYYLSGLCFLLMTDYPGMIIIVEEEGKLGATVSTSKKLVPEPEKGLYKAPIKQYPPPPPVDEEAPAEVHSNRDDEEGFEDEYPDEEQRLLSKQAPTNAEEKQKMVIKETTSAEEEATVITESLSSTYQEEPTLSTLEEPTVATETLLNAAQDEESSTSSQDELFDRQEDSFQEQVDKPNKPLAAQEELPDGPEEPSTAQEQIAETKEPSAAQEESSSTIQEQVAVAERKGAEEEKEVYKDISFSSSSAWAHFGDEEGSSLSSERVVAGLKANSNDTETSLENNKMTADTSHEMVEPLQVKASTAAATIDDQYPFDKENQENRAEI